jgi:hypothetical protein
MADAKDISIFVWTEVFLIVMDFSTERGPCDLQSRCYGSWCSQTEHAVYELPARRVRNAELLQHYQLFL